jgi:hypothetical protein
LADIFAIHVPSSLPSTAGPVDTPIIYDWGIGFKEGDSKGIKGDLSQILKDK